LKFSAKKPQEEDSGNPSGEGSEAFTLPKPERKLAFHAVYSAYSARGSLAETEAGQRAVTDKKKYQPSGQ
jgi:hypothetical protein